MPDEVRSQKHIEIKVSEANRKPMTYTLAVVDEGLLDITGFKTPDPWNYFYAREALGVKTWDLYDYVLGAFGGTLERIFAIGGDEALADKSANKAKRFIPVVRFLGPFNLGTRKNKYSQNNSSSVYRVGKDNGNCRKRQGVRNCRKSGSCKRSTYGTGNSPRVISPGEKVALPVTLFIQKEK